MWFVGFIFVILILWYIIIPVNEKFTQNNSSEDQN